MKSSKNVSADVGGSVGGWGYNSRVCLRVLRSERGRVLNQANMYEIDYSCTLQVCSLLRS